MLDDRDFDELMKPLVEMYSNMECELLKMIAERFKTYSDVSGSLEWYVKKLDELGGLNQAAIKLIAKYSKKSEQQIKEMLENAGYKSVPMDELQRIYEQGGTSINPKTISISRLLENSFVETKEIFKLIQTKALEGSKKAYMDVLNQAYLEVGGGYYDYNTSIKNACKKMAEQGITCATYKRKDGKIVNMSIESVVRRDTLTAINSMANKANDQYAQELQAKHVYVSEHLGARNVGTGWKNHESWQGQVYLINGSNEQYKNFEDTTGYGKVDGLGGVNCKHKHWAFFPGFSIEPKKLVNDEENSRIYELSQEQRYYERMMRKWKKKQAAYEGLGDDEGALECKHKVKEWQNKLQEFINKNPEMKRDYARERVYQFNDIKNIEQVASNLGNKKVYITEQAIDKVGIVKLEGLEDKSVNLQLAHKELLKKSKEENFSNEVLSIVDVDFASEPIYTFGDLNHVNPNNNINAVTKMAKSPIESLIWLHNHALTNEFSYDDLGSFAQDQVKAFGLITNKGKILMLNKTKRYDKVKFYGIIAKERSKYANPLMHQKEIVKSVLKKCKDCGIQYIK